MMGSEYSGTTTIAKGFIEWIKSNFNKTVIFHDHWKIPQISGHPPTDPPNINLTTEEQILVSESTPPVKELLMRYALYYHTPHSYEEINQFGLYVGYYFDDLIYGPKYFDYGKPNQPGDRVLEKLKIEQTIMKFCPDTVLALVKCNQSETKKRMQNHTHKDQLGNIDDIKHFSNRFQKEFDTSLITNKIVLDTSNRTVEESVYELVYKLQPFFTKDDRIRLLSGK